jgi:16S rRNA (adenine1518-N6/adenine1519-N6)-dimethyltransferase
MSLRRKAKHLAYIYGVLPNKRLGQNFLVDSHFLEHMCSYATLQPSDTVLEVGAGLGFLTGMLTQKSKSVIAVEVDARLVQVLKNELADVDNLELLAGDIFKVALPPFNKVVSNPPFSISSPLIFWLLGKSFECAVLTLQNEFAQRLDAPVDSEGYGRLAVFTYYHAAVELLEAVPKEAFYPSPEVDAAMVGLRPKDPHPFKVEDEGIFNDVVRTLFTQRNRKVRKALLPLLRKRGASGAEAQKSADLLPCHSKRVRELAPEDFGALANALLA